MDVLTPHQTLLLAFGEWGELAFAPLWLQLESIPVGVGLSSALLLSVGLVGSAILDRFFGDDEVADDGDPLMNDDGLEGDDGFDDFDDMGEMDDWDDPFGGDADEDGESTDELDHRLTELEDEVARLSSTVNTVRSENTEISNTVDDIGENVRKLLDIYEMVTRGINPFVDDAQPGGGAGGFEDGSLGLFDSDDEETDEDELDDSVASADAEGFFDEELLDDADDELVEFDETDADEFEDETGVTEEMETEITDDSSGKSFSELKDEYEAGEAEWADDDFGFDEGLPESDEKGAPIDGEFGNAEPVETDEMLFEADTEELAADEPAASLDEAETSAGDVEAGSDSLASAGTEADSENDSSDDGGFEFGHTTESEDDDARPYLTALPDEYVGDLLVIEWMEFLVENADVADAARAVRYYERIGWLAPDVARTLESYLVGFGRVNVAETDRPGTMELSQSHHVRSLEYVRSLSGESAGVGGLRTGGIPAGAAERRGRPLRHDGGEDGL